MVGQGDLHMFEHLETSGQFTPACHGIASIAKKTARRCHRTWVLLFADAMTFASKERMEDHGAVWYPAVHQVTSGGMNHGRSEHSCSDSTSVLPLLHLTALLGAAWTRLR